MQTQISLSEPRLIREVGLEAQIATAVESVILPVGFRLVRVFLSKLGGLTIQIMAERDDGRMTIKDCERISRMLSPVLHQMAIFVDRNYNLEVSSPGIDRPLVRYSDFIYRNGCVVKVMTKILVNGQKKFRGSLAEVDLQGFVLKIKEGKNIKDIHFFFTDLIGVYLVLTDPLIHGPSLSEKMFSKK